MQEENNIAYYPSTGHLNVILGVTHGGQRSPPDIPDRDAGCFENQQCTWNHNCSKKDYERCPAIREPDFNVIKLATSIRDHLCVIFNSSCPAMVINLLQRIKYDANRNLSEATFLIPSAVDAFHSFHKFIKSEISSFENHIGGLYLDIHGHGHQKQWTELGYMVNSDDLEHSVESFYQKSSLHRLLNEFRNEERTMEDIFRGNKSFGGFLQKYGYDAIPSPQFKISRPFPYFHAGFNTLTYGSRDLNSKSDAIMIEACRSVRNDDQIPKYSCALALTIKEFLCTYYYSKAFLSQTYSNILNICNKSSTNDIC